MAVTVVPERIVVFFPLIERFRSLSVIHAWHFTFMWPCSVTNFFIIKPTRCTKFTNLFWHETVHASGRSTHDTLMEKRKRKKKTGMKEGTKERKKEGTKMGKKEGRHEGRKDRNMYSVTAWYIPCTCSTEFWFFVWVINKSERQSSHSHVDWPWCLLGVSGSIVKRDSSQTRSRWPEWPVSFYTFISNYVLYKVVQIWPGLICM